MDKSLHEPELLPHDGTSQTERTPPALDPATVPLDGRSLEDLLAYAAGLGKALRYFGLDDEPAGDWSALVPGDPQQLAKLAAFADDPASADPAESPELFTPPRVLLLVFLRLLQRVQGELDTFGRRHLDYYYQQILGLESRPAEPDRVRVFFELEEDGTAVELEAGTLLDAGQDNHGDDRVYATERDLVVSRAQIAELSSVHVDYRVVDFLQARKDHAGSPGARALALFGLALGNPRPGDPLPVYPITAGNSIAVTYDLLRGLARLVAFCGAHLYMEIADFRDLMALVARRTHSLPEWERINNILELAGRSRRHDDSYHLDRTHPKAFHDHLVAALEGNPDYDGLPDVDTIYQLYTHRDRADVQAFIGQHLYLDLQDFTTMMQIKVGIDHQWTRINTLLQAAGRRKQNDPTFHLPYLSPEENPPQSETQATDFANNLQRALGNPPFSTASGFRELDAHLTDIDTYHQALRELESYFFLLAEEFAFVMESIAGEPLHSPRWRIVDRLLDKAHRERVFTARRKKIQDKISHGNLRAGILYVLGETHTQLDTPALLAELRVYIQRSADADFLGHVANEEWSSVSPLEKQRVYEILERAERARQQFVPPPAQRETWRNLYPAANATRIVANRGGTDLNDNDTQAPRAWKTFGATPTLPVTGPAPRPNLGWALSSPALTLSGGERALTLTLVFSNDLTSVESLTTLPHSLVGETSPLLLQASTHEGWLEPEAASAELAHVGVPTQSPVEESSAADAASTKPKTTVRNALVLHLFWTRSAAPITALPEGLEGGVDSPWPVLRLMLRPLWDVKDQHYHTLYPELRDLRLLAVDLQVEVTGMPPQALENDENPLDPDQPFEPFGDTPVTGLRFRIGSSELACQDLESLTFHVRWTGAPNSFSTYYANYPAAIGADSFKAAINLVDQGVRKALTHTDLALFEPDPMAPHSFTVHPQHLARDPAASSGDRWFEWQLGAPDFQHQAYPGVAGQKAIEMALDIAKGNPKPQDQYQVNPPYTPRIQSLTLDYNASLSLGLPPDDDAPRDGLDTLFHLHPLGYAALDPSTAKAANTPDPGLPLLPLYDNEGELYISLRDVEAPQGLTLFFQLDADSADSDLPPEPIQWSALSGNRWLDLGEGQIVRDGTRGLINSGIVELLLDPVEPSTLLPADLYWLRAAVARNSDSLCDTLSIHCQGVEAVFLPSSQGSASGSASGSAFGNEPLPAGSITELVAEQADIAAVHQPYSSYGGRPAEPASRFATRVSERLRHKDRALQTWDYERLVLAHFPQIYKAKCLPVDLSGGDDLVFGTPGSLRVVVLPDIRGQVPFEPFEPKAPSDVLAAIGDLLAERASTFARVKVQNARFVTVLVRMWVHFTDRGYERLHINQLNEALERFLSPWAYEEGADIVIGGRIYANSILDFVDRQPYVDFVEDLRFFTSLDGESFTEVPEPTGDAAHTGYFVAASEPDQVLATARRHQILPFFPDGTPGAGGDWQGGIGHMTVGLDFIVGGLRHG